MCSENAKLKNLQKNPEYVLNHLVSSLCKPDEGYSRNIS
jgi:hypothetical protein